MINESVEKFGRRAGDKRLEEGKEILDLKEAKRKRIVEILNEMAPSWRELEIKDPKLEELGRIAAKLDYERQRRKKAEKELELEPFTGLLNREAFLRKLKSVLEQKYSKEQGYTFILALDLDYLHQLNSIAGHKGGDTAIKGIADSMRKVLRLEGNIDLAARAGGDEFYIMLNNVPDRAKAQEIAVRLADMISKIKIENYDKPVSVSIGCIEIPANEALSSDELIRFSEIARGLSKINGRGSYTLISRISDISPEERDQQKISQSWARVNFQTKKFARDRDGNPIYGLTGPSGNIETAKISLDQCRYDVLGSLDRVYDEIESHYGDKLTEYLKKQYEKNRLTQLNPEELEGLLFEVRQAQNGK
jgi:diguanylate cyclase (GGDEF)-like protein